MRQKNFDSRSSISVMPLKGLLVAGILTLVLLMVPWLDLPYGDMDWVVLGQPYETVTPPATVTATVTLTPTTTATAVLTPTATATSVTTPTATSTPTGPTATPMPVPRGRGSLTARVFLDYRCDRIYQAGLDVPMGGVAVTLSFPNGASITRETRPFGLVNFSGFDTSGGVTVSVDLPSSFRGRSIASCPTSNMTVQVEADDFQFGFKFLQFGADVLGELASP